MPMSKNILSFQITKFSSFKPHKGFVFVLPIFFIVWGATL